MGYLHLYYDDYVNDASTPYAIILDAKQSIKRIGLQRLKQRKSNAQKVSNEYEQQMREMYDIKSKDFSEVNPDRWEEVNSLLTSYDAAILIITENIKRGEDIVYTQAQIDNCLVTIDKILSLGASMKGLTAQAIVTANQQKELLEQFGANIGVNGVGAGDAKKSILNTLRGIQSALAGALLEIARGYAYIGAEKEVLEKASDILLNIGGNGNVRVTVKQDPMMQFAINKINAQLKINKNIQSKADYIQITKDKISGQLSWTGFQDKNYSDISSVHVGNYSLGRVGITEVYDPEFLVNTAGGLGWNHHQRKIKKLVQTHGKQFIGFQQNHIDSLWANIKRTANLLGVADAVSGWIDANLTNHVDYYVIRNRFTDSGEVKLISVSEIFNKIISDFEQGENSSLGISLNDSYSNDAGTRSKYWHFNVDNYVQSRNPEEAKWERSNVAYPLILDAILQTKISISLNFSVYFR